MRICLIRDKLKKESEGATMEQLQTNTTTMTIDQDLLTVAADEGVWVSWAAGIDAKLLATDQGAESYIVRLAAGAVLPAHTHPDEEESLVLSGSLTVGEVTLQAGDFHLAPAGSQHPAIITATGAILFIRFACPFAVFSQAFQAQSLNGERE
jgi:quercetin dioxygenase-like cupin family protein